MFIALALAASIHAGPGTTYSSVAAQFGVSVQAVEDANPYPATDIPVGAAINVPGRSEGSAPDSSSAPAAAGPTSGFQSCVIQRESSGNPSATNGDHYGLYQMTPDLWRLGGGTGYSALGASVAEQDRVFQNIVAHDINGGTSNWTPYDHC